MSTQELYNLMGESLVNGILQGLLLIIKQPMFWIIIAMIVAGKIFLKKK